MYEWNETWLASSIEAALEPELPIVDPHHHLWTRPDSHYWLDALQADTASGHRVLGTVFIECMWGYRAEGPEHLTPVGETETIAAAAHGSVHTGSPILGIVSFADLTHERVGEILDAHLAAGQGLFRGIRHATALDPDDRIRRTHTRPTPALMLSADYQRGVAAMAERDLVLDVWTYHHQIPEVTALARAVPDCTIVLDHLGGILGIGPHEGRRAEILEQWRIDMAELATCPNVVVKLGGIGMTVFGMGFESRPTPPSSDDLVAVWSGPIRFAIEHFGPDRCMFESNFPVDKASCSYVTLWNSFKKMSADGTPDERDRLFRATAERIYRL